MSGLPEHWRAAWITAQVIAGEPHAAPVFRREWTLPSPVTTATLHLAGLGSANATINGQPIDDTHLGPGLSTYSVAARATTTDVSSLLADTEHVVLAVDLGRGFFDMHTPEVWQWSTAPWRDTPRLTAELHVQCRDGSTHVLITDEKWRTSVGGSRFDSLYEGETWDETREPKGWREPGFNDGSWPHAIKVADHPMAGRTNRRFAAEVATSGLPLREVIAEPIRVTQTIEPRWTTLTDGRMVGDVGRVVGGWARVTPIVDHPLDLSIRYGEQIAEDGSVIAENPFIPTGRFQRDDLVLVGRPWESRHTWKGFRYIEVSGASVGTQVQVEARVAHADVLQTGGVDTSDVTLNWLNKAFVDTVKANLHWVPTDTPTYEKNGWTGDALVALPAMLTRFNLSCYLASWLDDFTDCQLADGSLPVIVPSAGWGYGWSPCSPAPEWTTCYPVLVDALVNEYGLDLWPLHRNGVVAYLRYELGRIDDDGAAVGILGDYLSPGTGGPPPEDVRVESSLALWHALDVTSRALADSPEELEFAEARDRLALAVNRTWFDAERGRYSPIALVGSRMQQSGESDDIGYRQTPNVLALDAGIVPEEHRDVVLQHLIDDIDARGGHHNVGCLGMSRLCSVLVRHGRGDVALRVATNRTGPSWEAWRLAGHQTLLEMWVDPVRSRAHHFHGAGLRFVEDDLVGLRRTAAAWKRFEVRPVPVDGLGHANCVRGDIRAGWSRAGECIVVRVTVPDVAVAVVILPSGTRHEVGSGQHEWIEEVP